MQEISRGTKTGLAVVMFIVLGASCSSKNGNGDVDVCEPGDIQPCTCPGDIPGVQSCNSDGSGWGVCNCSPADTSTDGDDTVSPDVLEDTPDDPALDTPADTGTDTEYDGPPCDESPCGLIPNCGCPSGQKCSLHPDTMARHCIDAGTSTIAEPCENDDECEEETLCARMYSYSGEEEPICFGYCRDDGDCPGDASICLYALSPETTVGYCTIGCDLLTSEPCPDLSKCKWLESTGGEYFTDCIADVGTGTMGSSCSGENQCQRGYFCSGGTTCMGYCRITPPPDTCSFGCRQFSISGSPVDLVFDGVSYGYCWP